MKKLPTILLIFTLTLISFTACKNQISSPQNKIETIKIGAILPLTGSVAFFGESERQGIEMALDEINKQQNSHGYKFEIVFEDSQGGRPKEGAAAANKLVNTENIKYIFTSLTGVSYSAMPIISAGNGIQIIFAMDEDIPLNSDNVFRIYPSLVEEGKMLLQYAESIKPKHVAFVYYRFPSLEKTVKDIIIPGLYKSGTQKFTEEYFDQADSTTLRSIATKLKTDKPDLILVNAYYNMMPTIFKTFYENGILENSTVIGGLNIPIAYNLNNLEPKLIDNVIVAIPQANLSSFSALTNNFIKKYKSQYNTTPDYDAIYAYDAFNILARTIIKVGNHPIDVKRELTTIQDYDGVGGNISITPEGNSQTPWILGQYKNGQLIPLEP